MTPCISNVTTIVLIIPGFPTVRQPPSSDWETITRSYLTPGVNLPASFMLASRPMAILKYVLYLVPWVAALVYAGYLAYDIRLYAIKEFGLVIHEFDPWFNFRATKVQSLHFE